jgi:hypothetical protein
VFGPAVEVAADVFNCHCVCVIYGDLFRSSEDEVLGDFDSELGNMVDTPVIP